MKRIAIFFDTNILEARFSEKKQEFLFHHNIIPNKLFYDVINYIRQNKIEHLIDFCITSISWKEFTNHLIENYRERFNDFKQQETAYRKSFGATFDIIYEFKQENEEQYIEHIKTLQNDFLRVNKCTIVDYPNDIGFFNSLIDKCIDKKPPFKTTHAQTKTYTDAGLKDALILESIIRYGQQNNCITILVSQDPDFDDTKSIHICKSIQNLEKFLLDKSYISNESAIKNKIETDTYLKDTIVSMTGNKFDKSVTAFQIIDVSKCEDDDYFKLNIQCTINETIYIIDCTYDANSNEIELESRIVYRYKARYRR